jgi:RND family efflux transporter MFP subunit
MRGKQIATIVAGLGAAASVAVAAPHLRTLIEARAATEARQLAPRPSVVMVTRARVTDQVGTHRLAGTVRARTETDLGFRIGGKLLTRPVEVGATVAAGEVVATLDDTDLKLQIEAARAALAAAEIALEKGEIDLARVTTLEQKGWASHQVSDARTVDVEERRARRLQAERSVELVENALSYATLRADAAGVVTETHAEAGQVLALGQPVVRVARAGGREAVVSVPETLVAAVGKATAEAELWADPGRRWPVVLRELSPVADPATRTYEARFTLPPDADVALGMSVTVSLTQTSSEPAVELPATALIDTGNGPAVWVVGAGDRIEVRPVAVAGYGSGSAKIAGGLTDGERVVVMGAHRLQAGAPVHALEAEG